MVDIQLFGMVVDSTVLAFILPAIGVIIAYLNYRKKPAANPPIVSQSANNSSGVIQHNAHNMSIGEQITKINSPEIKNASAPIVNLINCTINIQNLNPLDLDKETVLKNISDCFSRNLSEMTGAIIKDASFELSYDKLKLLNVTREKVDQYSKVKGKPVKDASILRTLGNEAYYLYKPEDAFNYFTEALEIDEELKDKKGKAIDLNNIAGVYEQCGKPEEALEYYNKSLIIFNELKDVRSADIVKRNINFLKENPKY